MKGIVQSINTRPVTTKFGPKTTHSFLVDGMEFNLNFLPLTFAVGDTIEFASSVGKYGNDVVKGSLTKVAAEPLATPLASVPPPAAMKTAMLDAQAVPKSTGYQPKTFPLDPLHPDRVIVRQNSLTQARELVCSFIKVKEGKAGPVTNQMYDDKASLIIRLARKFEAYSAGDVDSDEVKAAMADEAGIDPKGVQ